MNGASYLLNDNWLSYRENTCYTNTGLYGSLKGDTARDFKIIEFKDLEDFKGFATDKEIITLLSVVLDLLLIDTPNKKYLAVRTDVIDEEREDKYFVITDSQFEKLKKYIMVIKG